jgi:predicted lipoprotein with Yx(FWY)xxD motif
MVPANVLGESSVHMRHVLTAGFALASLFAAACGSTSSSNSPGAGSTPATVTTGSTTTLGTVLTNSAGVTLYYLTTEQGGHDACTNMTGCAANWPALAPPSGGSPTAGSGASGQLTVITAADGSMEVAYNGWPLHTFSGDGGTPGKTTGNMLQSFGGTWYAATPSLTTSGAAGGASPAGASPSASSPY